MHKKHIFLNVFQKIMLFACVFCTLSAWADTTTCDINYTPVTGNSIQNGTPTPTNPVAIESIGTKVGNKYAVQIAINNGGGVVDLGTLNWSKRAPGTANERFYTTDLQGTIKNNSTATIANAYCTKYALDTSGNIYIHRTDKTIGVMNSDEHISIYDSEMMSLTATQFKQAMSGVMLYYQRATDETWTAPTLRTIYLDEPLRKVGDYADVLDYKNGTITRNVGVKVLDGTNVTFRSPAENKFYPASESDWAIEYRDIVADHNKVYIMSNQFASHTWNQDRNAPSGWSVSFRKDGMYSFVRVLTTGISTVEGLNAFLAQQYNAGTPVTVYYPLATPVVEQIENWSCTPPITDIKIATTKMVDEEFAATEAKLATTVQTIESVVSRTITQTGQIATLHETKQTRPDETCPANMKCLLVQDEDGTPHWYPIIEP